MANVIASKLERNNDFIKDYQNGMSTVDLVIKYRITTQRMDQIRKKHGIPARTKK